MPYRMVKGPHGSRVRQWYSEKKTPQSNKDRASRDYAIQDELEDEAYSRACYGDLTVADKELFEEWNKNNNKDET